MRMDDAPLGKRGDRNRAGAFEERDVMPVDSRAPDPRSGDPRMNDPRPVMGDGRQQAMEARAAMDARSRDEERRRRDASTINNLQQQIDELRGLMREYAARAVRGDELVKNAEAMTAEVRANLEDHRRATAQHTQARQLDENRIRQTLSQFHAGIQEAHDAIRTLQAQSRELIEQTRARRDTSDVTNRRFDELQAQITRLFAQQDRIIEVMKGVREDIDEVRNSVDEVERDVRQVGDAVRIVDSEAKRRVVEIEQRIEVIPPRIEEVARRVTAIEGSMKGLGDEFARIHNHLKALAEIDIRQEEEYTHQNEQALERHDLVLERIEEVRQQGDAVNRDLRHITEERDIFLAGRTDTLDESLRELVHRISMVNTRVDEVGQRLLDSRKEVAAAFETQVRTRYQHAHVAMEEAVELARRIAVPDDPTQEEAAPRPLRFGERGYATGGGR